MTNATEDPTAQTDALVERLSNAAIDTLEIASIHIGGRLGFYRGPRRRRRGDAGRARIPHGNPERYVCEWLEQQAVAGFFRFNQNIRPG